MNVVFNWATAKDEDKTKYNEFEQKENNKETNQSRI